MNKCADYEANLELCIRKMIKPIDDLFGKLYNHLLMYGEFDQNIMKEIEKVINEGNLNSTKEK